MSNSSSSSSSTSSSGSKAKASMQARIAEKMAQRDNAENEWMGWICPCGGKNLTMKARCTLCGRVKPLSAHQRGVGQAAAAIERARLPSRSRSRNRPKSKRRSQSHPNHRSRNRSSSSSSSSGDPTAKDRQGEVTDAKREAMQHLQDIKEMTDGQGAALGVADLQVVGLAGYSAIGERRMVDECESGHKTGISFHLFVRPLSGPQLPGSVNDRQIGWVTDAYLQDNRSEAMLASKWHRLVLQALEEVVAYAVQLETYLAQAKPEDRSADPEWMEKCMQFCLYLGTELQQITDALSQHGLSQNAAGKYAVAACEVVGSSEHELSVAQGARVLVVDADNADWIWCKAEDGLSEGWVPRSFLEMEPGSTADTGKDLPGWIKVNERARWWSNSQKQFCDVTITLVDESARQVTVTFVQDAACWKMVPFEHFLQKQEDWLLQPFQQKAKELMQQLPDWVQPGKQAYWWSSSQHRVLPVQIKDVCSRTRQVKVVFNCNKTVKKLVQFHELIDSPKECLLQKERSGHTWRKPRRKSRDSKGSKESAEAGSQTEVAEDLGATKGLGDIMAEMTQDIGDIMAEGDESEDGGGGLRKALTFMGSSEFLQVDVNSKDDSADRVPAFGYDDELATTAGKDDGAAKEETGEHLQPSGIVQASEAGTEIGDAIGQEDVQQAGLQQHSVVSKGKPAAVMGFSQSEENMMELLEATEALEAIEATVGDPKGIVTQEGPVQGGETQELYDTLDKELLAELAPPSSDEPSAEGAEPEDAGSAAAVSGLTLDAEPAQPAQPAQTQGRGDEQAADPDSGVQATGSDPAVPGEPGDAAATPAPGPLTSAEGAAEVCAHAEAAGATQENILEHEEATVGDPKGIVTQEGPVQGGETQELYDTLDKELLAELAPPSSDEPSAEGAEPEDAGSAAAVSGLTLDAEPAQPAQPAQTQGRGDEQALGPALPAWHGTVLVSVWTFDGRLPMSLAVDRLQIPIVGYRPQAIHSGR
ncbi:unnamed protein product [Symbiodinium natans]|uniref:SH3 domain-containing protein n=1 Tax=Symbiodinium natans TaxID=878477 RepID=A0A812U0B3_9DINO|nr:unnamed protein product [Symbiodinium natans]